MVLPKRRSIISKEERINRLREARQKYSQISKSKNPAASSATIPIGPRVSNIPRSKIVESAPVPKHDDEFAVDPNSLAMIKSGRINIPMNRPSVAASRYTVGSRPSFIGRPVSRFRASLATQEPRPSLLPLGINVFEANASQRCEVSLFLNSILTNTPGKSTASTSTGNNSLSAVRQRKIRFMDTNTAIPECRESAESEEVKTAVATTVNVKHSPISDASFIPSSILSTKRKTRKVNLAFPPVSTPIKISFDDDNTNIDKEKYKEDKNIEAQITDLEKLLDSLCSQKNDMLSSQISRIEQKFQKWQITEPAVKSKRAAPSTSLDSIIIDREGSVNEERERSPDKKKKRSSRMMSHVALRRSARGLFKQE